MSNEAIEDVELELLLDGIARIYGVDFRGYARPTLKRRLGQLCALEGLSSLSALQERVLREPPLMEQVLNRVAIGVSSMFRDPDAFQALRQHVVPWLRTFPRVRAWVAGCAGGEEVYTLAALLQEEGLGGRYRIYATDFNEVLLDQARQGIYPARRLPDYERNYLAAGGRQDLAGYFTAGYEHLRVKDGLRANLVFGRHDMATDATFNEFQLILCRNVLIYFGPDLQARVCTLLHQSLCRRGFLLLGPRDPLSATGYSQLAQGLYRRLR